MLDYKIIKKGNPLDPDGPKKYYAVPASKGLLETEKVCKEVTVNSTISVGEMYDCFRALSERIPELLLNGNSVRLGDLGTMRLSFKSDGADTVADYRASMIHDVKIIFSPSPELSDKVRREARFNRVSSDECAVPDEPETP